MNTSDFGSQLSPASPHLPPAASRPGTRALVLGGGGSTGNAWVIGVIAGLADAGLDVTGRDATGAQLTIGTSAGATAAAQLAGAGPAALLDAALQVPAPRTENGQRPTGQRPAGPAGAGQAGPAGTAAHLEQMAALIAASAGRAGLRRALGQAALERAEAAGDEAQERWRATVAARLASQEWPSWPIRLTAVDAASGDPVTFGNDSGVSLVDAVAASCASSLAYRIGSRSYIDGGYRRGENADLAEGYGRVLVLSPLSGKTLTPPAWGMALSVQVDELRAAGSEVETIMPSPGAEHLFGAAAMDLSLRPAAARAGFEQGRELAPHLSAFWQA